MLWDTGTQVSILSQEMIGKFFTKNTVKDISELIDGELNVMAANGTEIEV